MDFEFRRFQDRRMRPGDLPWDRVLVIAPIVILLVMIAVLAWQSVYTVEQHERAVVMRFGKYYETVGAGLWFRIPLVDDVLKVSVEEHSLRLPFGINRGRPGNASEEETLMLTGDLNAAVVEWTVQWKVTEPDKYLFRLYKKGEPQYAEDVIKTVAQTVMNRLVGDYSIDEVLTEKRGELAEEAGKATQQMLDELTMEDYGEDLPEQRKRGVGVRIADLQMQRVSPPQKVRPAFDEVNASIQLRDKLENEANKERNTLLPTAYAEKDKLIRDAEGYAERLRAETDGEIAALEAKFREYQKYPEETRQRLYLEAMEEVFASVGSKMIIDADIEGKMLPLLPLEEGGTR